jgi:hypothetical protein
MYGGVFHGCGIGSEGVGDTLHCLKKTCACPGGSPVNEGINQSSDVILAPTQSQMSRTKYNKASVIGAEGEPFVPHALAESSSHQGKDVKVGSESLAGAGLCGNKSNTGDHTIFRITLLVTFMREEDSTIQIILLNIGRSRLEDYWVLIYSIHGS